MLGNIKNLELFVFDLDDTLAPSKLPLEDSMVSLLSKLLNKKKIAVIGGGSIDLFKKQLEKILKNKNNKLENLHLFPTSGARYFSFDEGKELIEIYRHELSSDEKKKIITHLNELIEDDNFLIPKESYGEKIEDRGTQITFSALGQDAPFEIKSNFDRDNSKRLKMKEYLDKYLGEFDVRIGGSSSIDISKKGIDKAFGVNQMKEYLKVPIEDMFFFGDSIFEGGNDYSVTKTGIKFKQVSNTKETESFLSEFLSKFD